MSRAIVDQNHNTGEIAPVFTVIDDQGKEYKATSIVILGASALRYDSNAEQGQRVWIETFDKVVLYYGTNTESGNQIMETV